MWICSPQVAQLSLWCDDTNNTFVYLRWHSSAGSPRRLPGHVPVPVSGGPAQDLRRHESAAKKGFINSTTLRLIQEIVVETSALYLFFK